MQAGQGLQAQRAIGQDHGRKRDAGGTPTGQELALVTSGTSTETLGASKLTLSEPATADDAEVEALLAASPGRQKEDEEEPME